MGIKEEKSNKENTSRNSSSSLLKIIEGVNLDKINENLEGMKKILGVIGEFTKKDDVKVNRRSAPRNFKEYDD